MSEKIDVSSAKTYLHMADVNDDYIPLHPDDLEALATTVIEQAEQIETLSQLLAGAEKAAIERVGQIYRLQRTLSLAVVRGGPSPMAHFEYMYDRGELLPEDMEPTGV